MTTRSRTFTRVALAAGAVAAVAITAVAFAITSAGAGTPVESSDLTVTMTIRHSRFDPAHLTVRAGSTVRFVVTNDDPIGHEFIIGDEGVHLRHEAGTEPYHPPRPGEMSIAPGETAETTFTFQGATGSGTVVYACHLPGHFKYGMSGTVDVTPA